MVVPKAMVHRLSTVQHRELLRCLSLGRRDANYAEGFVNRCRTSSIFASIWDRRSST